MSEAEGELPKKRGPGRPRKQPGVTPKRGNRPPPGSLPPLDPASPTAVEKAVKTEKLSVFKVKRPKVGGRDWKPGERPIGAKPPFQKGHTLQPTKAQRQKGKARAKELAKAQTAAIIREMCQLAAPDAIAALRNALHDPKLAVTAANSLLDRGYGKPTQSVELTGGGGGPIKQIHVEMSAEEAARLYADTIAAGALPVEPVRQLAHEAEEAPHPENDH